MPKRDLHCQEAGLSTGTQETPDVLPSQDPNRIEALVISGIHVQRHESSLIVYEMVRDDSEKVIDLRQYHSEPIKSGKVVRTLVDDFVDGFRRGMRSRGH
jgi:hypothetical protein